MKEIKLMEVCGTHTMEIARSGIKKILPEGIRLISGPGCPVCVTAQGDIDRAIELSQKKDVIIATFGDMMRVPGTKASLEGMRRRGSSVRIVYSCLDALDIAKKNGDKNVVFMGVGFETTSPTVAATILKAEAEKVRNFFVLPYFKLIFPALEAICYSKEADISGFICPGHVSVITGSAPYEKIAKLYKKSCVITGFETIDILKGIERLLRQIASKKHDVEIEYKRAVTKEGNKAARKILNSVFEAGDSRWRGLGLIKKSGLKFREKYGKFDAKRKFKLTGKSAPAPRGCICGDILRGIKEPPDCGLFKKTCTPQNPVGPCMVSSEGACAAHYRYEK